MYWEFWKMWPVVFKTVLEVGFGFVCFFVAMLIAALMAPNDEVQRTIIEISGFFVGLSIVAFGRFELSQQLAEQSREEIKRLEKEIDGLRKELKHLTTSAPILRNFRAAMQQNTGTMRELIVQQVSSYEETLENAARGRMTIRSAQPQTIVDYPKLFDKLSNGAKVYATALLVPSGGYKGVFLETNRRFIHERNGEITRIFVFSRNSRHPSPEEWQTFIREQKNIGVVVKFLFREDWPGMRVSDVLISDNPRLATVAEADPATNTYGSVTLYTQEEDISAIEQEWKVLLAASCPFDKDDCITEAIHKIVPSSREKTRASCAWLESERDSRIGEILIQPVGWAEASRRWQSRIRKTCVTG